MSKDILMITRRFFPSVGGVEEQTELLCSQFQKYGYSTTVLTQKFDKNLPDISEKGGIKIYYFSNYFHYLFLLLKLAFGKKFHFIMVHQLLQESVILGVFKFLKIIQSPIVGCTHSGGDKSEVMKIVYLFRFLRLYKFLYFFIFQFEYINCLNSDIKNQLEKYIIQGKEKKQKKLIFIPNGIFLEESFSLPSRKNKVKNFLYLGRFEKEKGIFDTILAFKNINDPEICLNIVGYGDNEITNQIKNMIADDSRINFLGKKIGKEKDEILKITDVASSSSYSEGQPITLMEFAKYNIVVIASKVGNNYDLYGNNILYAKPGNIQSLQSQMQYLIENIGLFNYDYSSLFNKINIDNIVKSYLQLFP